MYNNSGSRYMGEEFNNIMYGYPGRATMSAHRVEPGRLGPPATTHGTRKSSENEQKPDQQEEEKMSFLRYAMETSTIMGPAKMWAAPVFFIKVMWVVLLLVASGMMLYQLVQLFQQYFRWEIKTEISLGFSPLALPAVTVCNTNRVRLSQASELSCDLQDVLEVPQKYQSPDCDSDYDFSYLNQSFEFSSFGCYGDSCDDSIDNSTRQQYYILVGIATEGRETLTKVGHQIEDMILDCSVAGRTCNYSYFRQSLSTDYGNCYTLSLPDRKSTRSGAMEGLDLTLNIESEEYVKTDWLGYGLRVVVHDHGTRPNPSNDGFTVPAASEVFVGVRMVNINSLGQPYGACESGDEYRRQTGNNYTIEGCRDLCVRAALLQKCNCTQMLDDFAIIKTDNVCNEGTEYNCMISFYNDYYKAVETGSDICVCPKPCSETVYQTSFTSHTWPLLEQVAELEKQACEQNSESVKCNYTEKDFEFNDTEIRRSSFMRLRLYFERLNYEIITEKPAYEVERFLSDIGGTLGLWIGGSALVIGEVLELVVLVLVKIHRNSERQTHQVTTS